MTRSSDSKIIEPIAKPIVDTAGASSDDVRRNTDQDASHGPPAEQERPDDFSVDEFMANLDIGLANKRFYALLEEFEAKSTEARQAEAEYVRRDSIWQNEDRQEDAFSLPSDESGALTRGELNSLVIDGIIKWFDDSDGCGIISPLHNFSRVPLNSLRLLVLSDVVFDIACLRISGFTAAHEGAYVRCEIAMYSNGWKARRFLSICDNLPTTYTSPLRIENTELIRQINDWERAMVKWFNRNRGFGFLTTGLDRRDIFVHMETVRRSGFAELRTGQVVLVRWGYGTKGCIATDLKHEGHQADGDIRNTDDVCDSA